jgi:hypothetical protein
MKRYIAISTCIPRRNRQLAIPGRCSSRDNASARGSTCDAPPPAAARPNTQPPDPGASLRNYGRTAPPLLEHPGELVATPLELRCPLKLPMPHTFPNVGKCCRMSRGGPPGLMKACGAGVGACSGSPPDPLPNGLRWVFDHARPSRTRFASAETRCNLLSARRRPERPPAGINPRAGSSPPPSAFYRFSSLLVGRRPSLTGLEARPTIHAGVRLREKYAALP